MYMYFLNSSDNLFTSIGKPIFWLAYVITKWFYLIDDIFPLYNYVDDDTMVLHLHLMKTWIGIGDLKYVH